MTVFWVWVACALLGVGVLGVAAGSVSGPARGPTVGSVGALVVVALAGYGVWALEDYPDFPLSERTETERPWREGDTGEPSREAFWFFVGARASDALASEPNDLRAWLDLARASVALGRWREGVYAATRGRRYADDPVVQSAFDVLAALGEYGLAGTVTPSALSSYRRAGLGELDNRKADRLIEDIWTSSED